MKRPTYFISSRSQSADIWGAELVLAIREQYSKVEGYSLAGNATLRTRIPVIKELSQIDSMQLHDKGIATPAAQDFFQDIVSELSQLNPQVAILVGYSRLHHILAKYFFGRGIPVVLYGLTPPSVWEGIDIKEIQTYLTVVIGFFPKPYGILQKVETPYEFLGSPTRDRIDRVKVSPLALGLDDDEHFLAVFPGNTVREARGNLPSMVAIAKEFLNRQEAAHIIYSLPLEVYQELKDEIRTLISGLKSVEEGNTLEYLAGDRIKIQQGMGLETIALARVLLTSCGSSTVEACLLKTPVISLGQIKSLANQIAERMIHPEYKLSDSVELIADELELLFKDGDKRENLIKDIAQLRSVLTGFTADNAAELIGREIATWSFKKKTKGSQPA